MSLEPYVVEDCRGAVQLMSDGTVRRSAAPVFPVEVKEDGAVEWKDVTYEPEHDLNVRLYKPRYLGAANDAKLPVVAYFHGGGFCIGSGQWPNFHAWCLRLAAELPAVVLSFDYRLAPEHRLPAAQEDGAKAMLWLSSQAATDPWLAESADFSRVFVAGDSAGGNITHHMAVKFGKSGLDSVRLRGFVLLVPAMAGVTRTRAELQCRPDAFLSTEMSDRYTRLILPEGVTRDYPVINPAGPEAPGLEAAEIGPMLVVAAEYDILRDRNAHYAKRMKEEWGKDVEFVEFAGQQHGFFEVDPWSEHADELVRLIKKFMIENADKE